MPGCGRGRGGEGGGIVNNWMDSFDREAFLQAHREELAGVVAKIREAAWKRIREEREAQAAENAAQDEAEGAAVRREWEAGYDS